MHEALVSNLEGLRERIRAVGVDPGGISIVAVTKGFGSEAVAAARQVGLRTVGENYAKELVAKAGEVDGNVVWHYLGSIQRNKVKALAGVVGCWQALAREEEAVAIARVAPGAQVFIEVNTTQDPARGGVSPGMVAGLVERASDLGLVVRGLMTVAPVSPTGAQRGFALVRSLVDSLGLPECSMGMSADLETAIAEGSTMVRVGEGLFGPRPLPRKGSDPDHRSGRV